MAIYRGPGGPGDATGDAASEAALAIAAAEEARVSANSAASSATSASNSATSSQGSADDADDSAIAAATSASSASVSATSASTSASNASTSATSAATSATNAATSESNTASLYDQFDDRYLGSKASNPTLDNDGNALLEGALYWNTVSKRLRIYNGTAWENTISTGSSGTVSSVDMTVPTGLQVSGNPITNEGTLAVTYQSGYSIPTTTKQGQWDTAYSWGDHAIVGYLDTADIGSTVQAYDADLTTLGAGGSTARSFLGLAIGTDVQAYDVDTTKNDVANTFTSNQIISVTDNTNAALTVTQSGTADGILVTGRVVSIGGAFRTYSDANRANSWWDATGTTQKFNVGYNATTTESYIGTLVSAPLVINTNNTERVRITPNGGLAFGGASNYGTSGQVLQSNGNAAPTWNTLNIGGMTLLGTLTTTSGSTQTLSGLTLTDYKQVYCVINGVSSSSTSGNFRLVDPNTTSLSLQGVSGTSTNRIFAVMTLDLTTGLVFYIGNAAVGTAPATGAGGSTIGVTTFDTADTSITFNLSAGNFDAGSILVYGVK